eukprot:GSMAST32.ASY1.ANO1.315.1 assembled CDS
MSSSSTTSVETETEDNTGIVGSVREASSPKSMEPKAKRPRKEASAAQRRLARDFRSCSAAPVCDSNMFMWKASVFGPEDSPWEGGVYTLNLSFTTEYPIKPPRIRFTTDMFHPNVYADGTICLDIIQKNWSPIYTVASILTSIQSLLTDPNPASPANPDAARMFLKDKKAYRRRIRVCVEKSMDDV